MVDTRKEDLLKSLERFKAVIEAAKREGKEIEKEREKEERGER